MKLYVTVAVSGTRTYAVEVPDDTPIDNPEAIHDAVASSDGQQWLKNEDDITYDNDLEITDSSPSRKTLWTAQEGDGDAE